MNREELLRQEAAINHDTKKMIIDHLFRLAANGAIKLEKDFELELVNKDNYILDNYLKFEIPSSSIKFV